MIRFKKGVSMRGVRGAAFLILAKAESIWDKSLNNQDFFGVDLVVTSARDGKHMIGSKHYEGMALDLRIRDFAKNEEKTAAKFLQRRLGRHYDVVLESDHIHVEYDPKE